MPCHRQRDRVRVQPVPALGNPGRDEGRQKGEAEEVLPLNGRIEHFNVSRGYGFIKDLGSGEKYFFHVTSAPEGITEGDNVTFEIERGTRGMNAVRISIINK